VVVENQSHVPYIIQAPSLSSHSHFLMKITASKDTTWTLAKSLEPSPKQGNRNQLTTYKGARSKNNSRSQKKYFSLIIKNQHHKNVFNLNAPPPLYRDSGSNGHKLLLQFLLDLFSTIESKTHQYLDYRQSACSIYITVNHYFLNDELYTSTSYCKKSKSL